MYIAVTADGDNLNSLVSNDFESATYLLIIDLPDLSFEAVKNEGYSAVSMAKEVIAYDCEAVITGELAPVTFDILAEACVTRYRGAGHTVRKALQMMEDYELYIIRNSEGTDTCEEDH